MSQNFDQLKEQCEFVTAMIREAVNQLQNGTLVDLKQIEYEAGKMIAQVKRADNETTQMLAPFVADLISALDDMALNIEYYKTNLKNNSDKKS